jgi:hypothetical protein
MTPYQPNWLTGVATITGYYQQVEDYEYEVSRICESFVVITGSDPFVQVMKDLVAYGNSIYKVDELGRPIVHIDLSELSDGERQQLMDSNAQSPVELVVFITVPQGMSPFGCYSPVEILIVQQPMVNHQ